MRRSHKGFAPSPPRRGFLWNPIKSRNRKVPGFALLELLLTILLLTSGLAAMFEAMSLGLFAASDNENSLVALNLAEEKMEEIKNTSYASIADQAKAAVSGFSVFQREVVVTIPQSNLKQVTVTVYWNTQANELNVALVTYVSNI